MVSNNEKSTLLPGAEFDIEPSDLQSTSDPSPGLIKRRRKINPNTVGDLSPSHFSSEEKRKKYVDMIKQNYKVKQVEIANLQKKIRKLEKKLTAYQGIFKL